MIIYQKAINSGSGNDVLLGGAGRLIANQCQHPGRMHMRAPGPSGLHGCCSQSRQPLPRGPPSAPPGYLLLTNEMIDTFNLELNLLTFPSERDILTGGMGRGSRGKMDACLLTCPAVQQPGRGDGHKHGSGWRQLGAASWGRRPVGTCSQLPARRGCCRRWSTAPAGSRSGGCTARAGARLGEDRKSAGGCMGAGCWLGKGEGKP